MRPFSKIVGSCLMLNRTGNVFKIFSRKKDGYVSGLKANDLARATGLVNKMEEVVAKVCDRSVDVGKALQYLTYLYPEHSNSGLTKMRCSRNTKSGESGSCKNFKVQNFQGS